MILQALPSTGKTWLKRNYPSKVVDTDDVLLELTGVVSSESHDLVLRGGPKNVKFKEIIQAALRSGKVVATNINMSRSGINDHPVVLVGYDPHGYIRHIKNAGRLDLIEAFGEETLRSWAQDYVDAGAMILQPSESLIDAYRIIENAPKLRKGEKQ